MIKALFSLAGVNYFPINLELDDTITIERNLLSLQRGTLSIS